VYGADNRRYPQVFRFRIARERRRLGEAEQAGNELSARSGTLGLVLDLLYAGGDRGLCTFDRSYRWDGSRRRPARAAGGAP
jgi:hypothetical protein